MDVIHCPWRTVVVVSNSTTSSSLKFEVGTMATIRFWSSWTNAGMKVWRAVKSILFQVLGKCSTYDCRFELDLIILTIYSREKKPFCASALLLNLNRFDLSWGWRHARGNGSIIATRCTLAAEVLNLPRGSRLDSPNFPRSPVPTLRCRWWKWDSLVVHGVAAKVYPWWNA